MKLGWPVEILGTGAYLPTRVVTNDELAARVDTTHDWIVQRTGIHERRVIAPGETTLSIAAQASRNALADAGLTPKDIELIVCATITPEHQLPATGCLLQAELGCDWIPAYDLAAACSGFVWAFIAASQYLVTGMARTVLVVGAEVLTNITDPLDRGTCILFGDAAAAAILRRTDQAGKGVLAARWGADGLRGRLIYVPAGGSKEPPSRRTVDERLHYMRMQGREVYKFAVMQMQEVVEKTCADAGIATSDVATIIPHQSNLRIIESAMDKLKIPLDRVLINIDKYGNTSAASVPIALAEAVNEGRVRVGDRIVIVAFGAGFTSGAVAIEWTADPARGVAGDAAVRPEDVSVRLPVDWDSVDPIPAALAEIMERPSRVSVPLDDVVPGEPEHAPTRAPTPA